MNNIDDLANAIILQAVADYKVALRRIANKDWYIEQAEYWLNEKKKVLEQLERCKPEEEPELKRKLKTASEKSSAYKRKLDEAYFWKTECEQFFLGDWIKELTKVDGSWILERIRNDKKLSNYGTRTSNMYRRVAEKNKPKQ